MKVTIIGSGTGMPRLDRSSSSVLIRAGGMNLVVDMGPGTLRRLNELGVGFQDIDAILLTHFHPDHTLDLWAYYFAWNMPEFSRQTRVCLIAAHTYPDLENSLTQAYGHWTRPPDGLLDVHLIDPVYPKPVEIGQELKIDSAPANHKPESLAYRINAGDKSVVITGDTAPSQEVANLALETNLLIADCSDPDDQRQKSHMTPSLAGQMASQARADKLVLTHLTPSTDGVDLISPAGREFGRQIVVAADGLEMKV